MGSFLKINLDLSKIDKSRIINGKNGGKYLDLICAQRQKPDEYGNTYYVYVALSKEERKAGAAKTYLGSAKVYTFDENGSSAGNAGVAQTPRQLPQMPDAKAPDDWNGSSDDLPF